MYKKLLLIGLISLIPVQAWAVLDMGMQKQIASTVSPIHAPVSIHPCHQDGNDAVHHSMNDQQAVEVSGDRCYSCTLCMAFGLLPDSIDSLVADQYTQTFQTTLVILTGINPAVVNKPPIH
jgi:hypothetical protein